MLRKTLPVIFIFLLLSNLGAVKIGYALSGGGARGFAHIGMLKVMEEIGIKPDYVSGTSIGALIGGLYCMGYNAAEIESLFIDTDWSTIFSDNWNREELYIGQKRWAPYGNATFRLNNSWQPLLPQAVIIGNRINLELFRIFSPASEINDFNKLPIPFSAIATDLVTGDLKAFRTGSLMQAVRASMSIPSILQPFPLNNTLYIDGGLSQNLPGKQVKDMGADYVIGFKVNSNLQSENRLHDLLHILDQTINIGITNNLNEQISFCDCILEPDLDLFSATSFKNLKAIIKAGEDYARNHLGELIALRDSLGLNASGDIPAVETLSQLPKIRFNKISAQGNTYLSSSIIRDYAGLHTGYAYSVGTISKAMNNAWNSQLFEIIYPVIQKDSSGYELNIFVRERDRKHLIINTSYDKDNDFVAAILLSLDNFFMKNSNFLADLELGGKTELNLDFVKNFGQAYGVYYRLFPYLNEKRMYFYNSEHEKTNSARSLEYGLVVGLGFFARKTFILEAYGFTYTTKLYGEIAFPETMEKAATISGIGFKAYHESLNDYVFPSRGAKTFIKASFAKQDVISDQTINKLLIDYEIFHPLTDYLSISLGASLGTHFKQNNQTSLDPFYLGGFDNFSALQLYEKSAPFYELLETGLVFNPVRNLYINAKYQALNYSDTELLIPDKEVITGSRLEIGYMTHLGPIRAAIAYTLDNPLQYYLSIGYTSDIFHLSRR